MKNKEVNKTKRRVIALLSREEMEFLDKMAMDSLFTTKHKLKRVDIISALINTAIQLGVSAKNIHNKEELVQRVLDIARTQRERRQFPRLNKNLHVGFRKVDSSEKYKHATATNIGMGGFRMEVAYLDKPPQVHQVIEITMSETKEDENPIQAIGRIAWIREKEKEEGLEIGVMLTYIEKEYKEKFKKYLCEEGDELSE